MSWRTEWKCISDRIEGLLEAGRFFAQLYAVISSDEYGIIEKELLPHARAIFLEIKNFQRTYNSSLSQAAINSIERFIELYDDHFTNKKFKGIPGLKLLLPCLASFRSEFTFLLSDMQTVAKRITERALIHLQRSIIADQSIKKRWVTAFKSGETDCERLGAAHLLLHGIWAFKASAEGERTDLILGEPLVDLFQIESTADALVLTEWKVIRSPSELHSKAKEAFQQASIYSDSSLAGFELAGYRYLVLVSDDRQSMPPDKIENEVVYHHVNIAVNPKVPSKTKGI